MRQTPADRKQILEPLLEPRTVATAISALDDKKGEKNLNRSRREVDSLDQTFTAGN